MRYLVGLICVLALGVMSLVGCGDTNVTVYCGTDGAGPPVPTSPETLLS